ncbi:acyl-CoA synthetase [Candidatus Pelagisphaera phototrophica]|uniref:acyl-CoA synthetase n=1 Tax=Candidatus Pelagisphaera phototrophica TaxID=2684113 RepID=UPI001A0826D6|nr:acyl-CoA synthetase [Candidatus Pelagisphaera phototrophica]QXD31989.1 acyl-CoA synthetase [Candidatus Pelagisphaera phototrophica]
MDELPLFSRVRNYGEKVAISNTTSQFTYKQLLTDSAALASTLLGDEADLKEARIAFLAPGGPEYATIQWGIWRAGGVITPLCLSAAEPEFEYSITDSEASRVIATREQANKVASVCERLEIPLLVLEDLQLVSEKSLPMLEPSRRAMILYTSGTTSKPKGVVTTHGNIQAQIESLIEAWEWQASDRIPLFLPLHHVHGIINVLSCALWMGASIETFSKFEYGSIFKRVAEDAYTVFMAVPTIYVKLIEALEDSDDQERSKVVKGFNKMRLMVSGSAALPASVHMKWTELTGQKLLERYGMTEIGMALSNPFHGERRPGSVGQALPLVEIRLKTETGELVKVENEPGEIQVRGPCVFNEYWNRPEITKESFDDGWFRTGDMAVMETEYYRIMGRLSVDIIKSGGYKLSALEIEAVLLQHPNIRECAVIGHLDKTWGEVVAAAVILKAGSSLDLGHLRDWCRNRLSHYKLPKRLLVVDTLPRNTMGKVTKPAVKELF